MVNERDLSEHDKSPLQTVAENTAEAVGQSLGMVPGTIEAIATRHPHPIDEMLDAVAKPAAAVGAAVRRTASRIRKRTRLAGKVRKVAAARTSAKTRKPATPRTSAKNRRLAKKRKSATTRKPVKARRSVKARR